MAFLVLIPGVLCDRRLWSNQIAGLNNYTEVSVADITQQSSVEEMARAILAAAPERFSLAGFSLGSQVALEIMSLDGDRIERLALLSATHGGLLPASEAAFRKALVPIETGGFQEYLDSVYPAYVAPRRAQDSELKNVFMEMAHTVGKEAGLRQMRALLALRKPVSNLDHIQCPTIIIGGREDHRTSPAAHEALAQEIPESRLVMIDDSGHFTTLEQPAAVTTEMQRWIKS